MTHQTDSTLTMPPRMPPAPSSAAAPTLMKRAAALLVAAATAAVLGVAAWLTPAAEGHGTHTQLGMPECNWVSNVGIPCPTCGMTTAFSHAAHGDFVASFLAQPLGFFLAIATACTFLVSLYAGLTGSALPGMLRRLWRARMLWIMAAMLLAAWGYKILAYKGVL